MDLGWVGVAARSALLALDGFVLLSVLVSGIRAALAVDGGVLVRWVARLSGAAFCWLSARLGNRSATLVMRLSAPTSLALVLAVWLAGWQLGTDVLVAELPATLPPDLVVVGHMTLVVLFGVHLAGAGAAWRARERGAAAFREACAAEDLLAGFVDAGGWERLDRTLVHWADWLAELRVAHRAWPVLLHTPPAELPSWLDAVVTMLDVAALAEAVVPDWAPPHTTRVLVIGRDCVCDAVAAVGATPPRVPISLHGREDRAFDESVRILADAGLRIVRDPVDAWADFQSRRICYAPAASALAERLGHLRPRRRH